ncbi:hypothetical protein ID866_12788 [Astraeus odoratus]|nr:hypothetical protein ID866_12788 [Astraeus odoratus]
MPSAELSGMTYLPPTALMTKPSYSWTPSACAFHIPQG